jgi:hypothetical protein
MPPTPLLLTALLVQQPGSGRIDGNPNFQFVCKVGGKQASIATENGALVYRFGRPGRPELTIRQKPSRTNVRYRIDWWEHANSQHLRFANGRYSYGVSSWFVAGRDGEEGVGLFVMRDRKVISWRRCGGAIGSLRTISLDGCRRTPSKTFRLPLIDRDDIGSLVFAPS